uniref:Chitin-binding type-2 domain-containing protein n=1 Tax=Megaselia scalaris TaxID=36166 RepID=T1H572_MEGSC
MNFGDEWQTIITETCGDGELCTPTNGTCIKQGNEACYDEGSSNVVCGSEGFFPNPYDCHKYYICYYSGETILSVSINCPQGYVFDAAKEMCSASATTSSCTLQIDCSKTGQYKPWPTNNKIFYI